MQSCSKTFQCPEHNSASFPLGSFQPLPAQHVPCNSCQLPSRLTCHSLGNNPQQGLKIFSSAQQQSLTAHLCAAALYTTETTTTRPLLTDLKPQMYTDSSVMENLRSLFIRIQAALLKQLFGKRKVKRRNSALLSHQCKSDNGPYLLFMGWVLAAYVSSTYDIPSILERGFA